jgi:hypothetical protein
MNLCNAVNECYAKAYTGQLLQESVQMINCKERRKDHQKKVTANEKETANLCYNSQGKKGDGGQGWEIHEGWTRSLGRWL